MTKEKKPDKDEKPQKERFIETAQEMGAFDNKDAFERAFKKIVPESPKT